MSDTLTPAPPATDRRLPARSGWQVRLSRWDHKGSPYAFVSPFFILFGIFGAFPLLYTFWVSLHDWPLLGDHTFTGLDNYEKLLTDPQFWNAAKNTLGIFVVSSVPQYALALWLAVTLNRKLRARTLFRVGVIIPNVTSVAAVTLIFGMIFARGFGLANWVLGWVGVEAIDWTAHTWSSGWPSR